MADDLRLANVTLHPSDSDVSQDIVLPAAVPASTSTQPSNFTTSYVATGSQTGSYWYNWHAAIAYSNNVSVETLGEATTSICAKNWQLPDMLSNEKSWYNLYSSYGYEKTDSYIFISEQVLSSLPFSLARTGAFYGPYYGRFDFYNDESPRWSKISDGSADAYFNDQRDDRIIINSKDKRITASVRCVAR